MKLHWLILLLFLGWCGAASWYYTCRIKQVCYERPEPPPPDARPVVFAPGNAQPVVRASFARLRDSVLHHLPAGQQLEIIGAYFAFERPPLGFPDMGIARAAGVRNFLNFPLPDDRLLLSSEVVTPAERDTTRTVEMIRFRYLEPNREVVEQDDRTLIYFPSASVDRIESDAINAYLDELADRLKTGTETVEIIGHTDDEGPAEGNYRLGLRRAKMLRDVLVRRGVPRGQILTDSRGETDPEADNDTPEGRQRNRRVEVLID